MCEKWPLTIGGKAGKYLPVFLLTHNSLKTHRGVVLIPNSTVHHFAHNQP